ncbi:PaaI family thioesterase [Aerosticca soli]|uniref:Phenylacetic acid degradation-related protein n=1 Tax=Aerosticca soli TaxID=2010829 RepID=A0A2Z6E1K1_9GAMM|nr:PaaI family thioesterase [Aerosticca soli]BBD78865.1 phenylacetic acid degradation-related protein [Aerosticca soli]
MNLAVTVAEIRHFLREQFPQTSIEVESVDAQGAWVRQAIGHAHLRPGGTVSGPTMMATADCAAYVVLLSRIGLVPLAVTTQLSINFLRKPAADRDIRAHASLLKLGKRLAVAEIRLYSEGGEAPVAHAVATYAIPPR